MSAFLKTLYLCAKCGEPTKVRHSSEAKTVCCAACSERRRLLRNIGHRDYESDAAVKASRDAKTGAALMRQALLAVAKRLEAAAVCLDVSETAATVKEQRHLLTCAESRIAWADATLTRNMRHMQAAKDEVLKSRGIQVLDGGRTGVDVGPEPIVDAGVPPLRIVFMGEGDR